MNGPIICKCNAMFDSGDEYNLHLPRCHTLATMSGLFEVSYPGLSIVSRTALISMDDDGISRSADLDWFVNQHSATYWLPRIVEVVDGRPSVKSSASYAQDVCIAILNAAVPSKVRRQALTRCVQHEESRRALTTLLACVDREGREREEAIFRFANGLL